MYQNISKYIKICILKTMFDFVFKQMTKVNTQYCNKLDFSMILKIKNAIGGCPDKF